jgi:NADH:ubiquinone reductase (H+-translocating)
VHLFYLIGFQNRLIVFTRWTISFVTHGRGERLITHPAGESNTSTASESPPEREHRLVS